MKGSVLISTALGLLEVCLVISGHRDLLYLTAGYPLRYIAVVESSEYQHVGVPDDLVLTGKNANLVVDYPADGNRVPPIRGRGQVNVQIETTGAALGAGDQYIRRGGNCVPVGFLPWLRVHNLPRRQEMDDALNLYGCDVSRNLSKILDLDAGGIALLQKRYFPHGEVGPVRDNYLRLHQISLPFHERPLSTHDLGRASHLFSLISNSHSGKSPHKQEPPFGPFDGCAPGPRVIIGCGLIVLGWLWIIGGVNRRIQCCGVGLFLGGTFVWLTGHVPCQERSYRNKTNTYGSPDQEAHGKTVPRKLLTYEPFPYYNNYMANVLSTDKQITIVSALCEGSGIRSIERMTGVHRDTITRLGVKVGKGCTDLMDAKMRNLDCNRLEMDEIWGFIGKKEKHVGPSDNPQLGDVWTFCAIDAETKLVPAFKCGKRDSATANAFVGDVSSRMKNRVQISTDGLRAYVDAVEQAFGADVDYAQIIKTYGHEEVSNNRRYSAPEFVSSDKRVLMGKPDQDLISTSYVERLNATTRLHMRRLTRLTLAFSKKFENFEAAVGLHFAYYNLVKRHNTLRCTPAMAAGVSPSFWTVGQLVEEAA